MDLGNSIETIVHYLLIREMTCFIHWDEFQMVNALVYTIT